MREEIKRAIHNSKNNRTVGMDEVPGEIFKLLDEGGIVVLQRLFNNIYESGQYPTQWLSSIFIPLPKKNNARECENHRLISLMSHTLKIFLKIIQQRISRKCEENFGNTQFGFRQGLGGLSSHTSTSTKLSRYEGKT